MKKELLLLLFFAHTAMLGAQITIVGCGYVGLTLAALLLDAGHQVDCVEKNGDKYAQLVRHQLYIYEPHLEEMLFAPARMSNLTFYPSLEWVYGARIFYVSVPSPIDASGACDCAFLFEACVEVAQHVMHNDAPIILCVKSTVPPGTMAQVRALLARMGAENIELVYNPEFMREGCALRDIYTNPVVLGSDSSAAMCAIEELYANLHSEQVPVIKTTFETAEMIKYSWNAFSAIRIAYANELAVLCREVGADVKTVIQGFALSEQLLPTATLKPGPGFGGSCLPKDTRAFATILEQHGFDSSLVHQAIESNRLHKERVIRDIRAALKQCEGEKIVTLLGLSFKANTNDIRNAPAIDIIKALLADGVTVHAYDPQAMDAMWILFPQVHYFDCPYAAVKNADCVVALTEWHEIKSMDLEQVAAVCPARMLIDTRNMFETVLLKKYGFTYSTMGAL